MNLRKILYIIVLFCSLSNTIFAQNIVVDDTFTAQQLVQNVLLNNTNCATSSNAIVSGDNFSNGEQSYGAFTYTGTDFPFASGVVLSTSRASRTAGPNDNLIDEGSTSWQGDSDLEQALNVQGTVNATALEFDFTPLTSQLSFDYIFASEEYQGNAPCRYSDGFAFLLKVAGSNDAYQNLALVPNTTTPVKVTSVHPLITGNNGCDAINEDYFASYNNTIHPINFNGETVVMTAKANVIPETTYHIKLVIADEENIRYDSAIFLGGGSFNVGTDLGNDRLVATDNPICESETYTLTANEIGTNAYKWFKDGIEIVGEITSSYEVSETGIYNVQITLGTTVCVASGEVKIEYATLPVLTNPVTLVQCDANSDGITTFNLTKLDDIIKQGNTQLNLVNYYWNQSDAEDEINVIQNPNSYSNVSSNTLVARVTNQYGCASYATVNLEIANNTLPNLDPIIICDEDGVLDGKTTIDLNQQVSNQLSATLPSGLIFEYYATNSDAVNQNNILTTIFTNSTANSQTLFSRIVNGPDCYGILPINLQIVAFDPLNFENETIYLCENTTENLAVATGFSSYLWNTGEISESITVSMAGNYSVTVTNSFGCEAVKTFLIIASQKPTITSVEINDFSGSNNSVTITVSGIGNYEYSLDGILFLNSPTFKNVLSGVYEIIVRDKYLCGTDTQLISVLDYPKFFTPNGDGVNDTWDISNLTANAKVQIFDRFGKFIYNFNGSQSGWNGYYENSPLLATDYWFIITLENQRIIKGHFSLKR